MAFLGQILAANIKEAKKNRLDVLKKVYGSSTAIAREEDLQIEQLEEGKTNKGELITPSYRSDQYAMIQQHRYPNSKRPEGTPLLKDTGSFHSKIRARALSKGLSFDSTDSKSKDLEDKYEDIFSLNEEKLTELKLEFDNEFYGELLKQVFE